MSRYALSPRFLDALVGSELSACAMRVVLFVGRRQGSNTHAWPSVAAICVATNSGERTVRRALAELRDAGLLTLVERPGKGYLFSLRTPAGNGTPDDGGDPDGTDPYDRGGTPAENGTSLPPAPLPGTAPLPKTAPLPVLAWTPAKTGQPHLTQEDSQEGDGAAPARATTSTHLDDPPLTLLRDRVAATWIRTHERHRGAYPAADSRTAGEIAEFVIANVGRAGMTTDELLDALLAAYWREEWPRAKGSRPSLRNVLSRLDRLLADMLAATPTRRDRAFDPTRDNPETPDEERIVNEWIAAGSPMRRTG